jgi:hypothetical protein
MKTLFIPLMAGLLISCVQSAAIAQDSQEITRQKETIREERRREQEERTRLRFREKYPEEFKEHISKQFTLQKTAGSVVAIYNLNGPVKVEGYSGDKVLIEIDKTISATTKEVLEEGKKEARLEFEQVGDSLIVYIVMPWDTRPNREWRSNNWDNNRRIDYNLDLSFTVKVPFNVNLRASTVNNGNVTVKDVGGALVINNVNGAIDIVNAKGTTKAYTINGDLTANYLSTPPEASAFYTLNGKLTVTFPPSLSADLQFKSMNGAFYTDFENSEILAPTVTKNQETNRGGTLYRLNKDTQVRIGSGERKLKFETMNGNIYIKKQS